MVILNSITSTLRKVWNAWERYQMKRAQLYLFNYYGLNNCKDRVELNQKLKDAGLGGL